MLHYKDEFETEDYKIVRYCIGEFGVNTYVIICKKTRKAAVVDPGGEAQAIAECIRDHSDDLDYMLLTHAHIDHVAGAKALADIVAVRNIAYHADEDIVVEHIPYMCKMFGVPIAPVTIHTPGHTPGGVCFYIAEHDICFTGDTLFKGSVGRTDFEGGDGRALRKSLDSLIAILGDDVKILPGHGKYSTMGNEKQNNFYLKIDRYR